MVCTSTCTCTYTCTYNSQVQRCTYTSKYMYLQFLSTCTYMYIHVHVHTDVFHIFKYMAPDAARKIDCLGCSVLLLPCLLDTLLASFFLPSHLTLKHVHIYMYIMGSGYYSLWATCALQATCKLCSKPCTASKSGKQTPLL